MLTIFKKEVNALLSSLTAYLVIVIFLTAVGLFTWVFPDTNVFDYGFADLSTLFNLSPYVLMFLVPAITMRTFAEEKKAGTLELLFTKPLTDWDIILGKYLACLLLVVLALLPTLVYYYTVFQLGSPPGNVDSAGVTGSYLGLVLLGGVFAAIGTFASAISENQVISFLIAVFLCFLLHTGISSLAGLAVWGGEAYFVSQLGLDYHYNALSKGLIDLRNVVYFLGVVFVMLSAAKLVIGSRKW
ncbi:MAG: gliding motility-associated ABC transporter permease subunit GldF [Ferruginibacter sp.]|nr:gliding motility-associated ABC transporter permease subunit GldF [Cytophagales bacterium]